ncbi:hypothetical protein IJZ97_00525, partial [bacterium]|nr:hypothetical protein [bacterium]
EEMINGNVINMELAGFVGKNIFIFEMISAVTSISLFTFPLIYQEKLANGHCFRDNINKSISDKITTSCLLGMSLLTVDKISSFYPLNEERLKQEWYMRNTIYMKKLGENLDKYLNKNDKFVPTAITKLTIHKTLETATYICSELISEINEKEYTKYISYLTTKCLQIAERLYELNRYLERNA